MTEPVIDPGADVPRLEFEDWQRNKSGREFVPRGGAGKGMIFRQGDETVAQARERDSQIPAEERRPRRKTSTSTPPKPRAPKKADLKLLEQTLADALQAPAMACAAFGDEWGANHFQASGPYLARNLIHAAEYNPWLKEKLETAAEGGDMMMKIMGSIGVAGALVMYVAPPIIYFLNVPVPDKTRELMNIPPRKEPEPLYADTEPEADQAPISYAA